MSLDTSEERSDTLELTFQGHSSCCVKWTSRGHGREWGGQLRGSYVITLMGCVGGQEQLAMAEVMRTIQILNMF